MFYIYVGADEQNPLITWTDENPVSDWTHAEYCPASDVDGVVPFIFNCQDGSLYVDDVVITLKSSFASNSSIVYGFDSDSELEDWNPSGSVSIYSDDDRGSCLVLSGDSSISRNIDLSNVEKLEFW